MHDALWFADSVDTLIGSAECVYCRRTEKQLHGDRRLSHIVVVVVVVVERCEEAIYGLATLDSRFSFRARTLISAVPEKI